jgi:hypothetical protein
MKNFSLANSSFPPNSPGLPMRLQIIQKAKRHQFEYHGTALPQNAAPWKIASFLRFLRLLL